MNCRRARKLLENLLNGEELTQDLAELQSHLEQCAGCRDWYEAEERTVSLLQGLEVEPAPPDFTQQVLGRLPDLSWDTLDKMVRLTRRAWKDPEFREALRAAPRQTVESWGLELPADLQVVVVSPGEATLPTRRCVALPLPVAGEGPLQERDLYVRLRDTEAAVWIQPELVAEPVGGATPRPEGRLQPMVARIWRIWDSVAGKGAGSGPRRMLRPALAMAAMLLVLFGLLYVLGGDRLQTTPGTVAGSAPWLLGAVVLGAGLLVAALIFWGRQK